MGYEAVFAYELEYARNVERLRAQARENDAREVLIRQIKSQSLRLTLNTFPDIARRLDGEAALRRVAEAWAAALLAEAR